MSGEISRHTLLIESVPTHLVISVSEKTRFLRIGINTLPNRNAMTSERSCSMINEGQL